VEKISQILDKMPQGLVKQVVSNFAIIMLIIFGIRYFGLSLTGVLILFNVFNFISSKYNKVPTDTFIKGLVKMNAFILTLYFIRMQLLVYGVIGYLIFICLWVMWRIYRQWDMYVWGVLSITEDLFKVFGKEKNLKPELFQYKEKALQKIEEKRKKNGTKDDKSGSESRAGRTAVRTVQEQTDKDGAKPRRRIKRTSRKSKDVSKVKSDNAKLHEFTMSGVQTQSGENSSAP
jgi:hypothetical protein